MNSNPILQSSICVLFLIGTKSALEKNPDQTVEDFHKLLTDVNNSQASTSEDNDEEEDDDAKNQTDEEDQSKPDDSSSEHSNAKSSTAANKKDQQSATSNSNRVIKWSFLDNEIHYFIVLCLF